MKKRLLTLLGGWCLLLAQLLAGTFPTLSTENEVTWYLVQFLNGENVLTATSDGAQVTTGVPTGRDAQLWKVEGSASAGYTLTSKTGLKLYTSTTAKQGMFYAAAAPAQNTLFNIVATGNASYSGGYEIQPKSNAAVSMNQWGGAGTGRELGLWDKNDANNPLQFVSLEDFNKAGKPLALIPYPSSLTRHEGTLPVSALTAITYPTEDTKTLAESFAAQLKLTSGTQLTVESATDTRRTNAVSLAIDETLGEEAYRLTVDADGVSIAASGSAGFFYAMQTLKQLLPDAFFGNSAATEADWQLPLVSIEDAPLMGHRGFMLDVARHFFDKEEVKRILDILAFYKMNRFHWHLTDDQGWRIQIPEYPLLTEIGSIRSGSLTNKGGSSYFYDDTEYGRGCWYTLDDLREVVEYARERHIEIIPEVDMPGHMVAAIAAYPEFSCDPSRKYEVRIQEGVSTDVLNIGKDEVIDFLKCVLGHIAEVFPYRLIHIGGDECPTTVWQNNADCARRIAEEGLSGVNDLQPWLVETLGTFLKEKYGKDIIVWDELLAHWNTSYKTQPVVMAWRSINYTATAADKGFSSICVPTYPLYFDQMQATTAQVDPEEVYQGGYGDNVVNSIDQVYNLNPLSALSGRESYCLGTQANLWTESCKNAEQAEYQLLPRLLALSETAWLPASKKNWVNFYQRLQSHDEILDRLGYTYAKHYIEQDEPTEAESALAEAESILSSSVPGEVGYPSQAVCDDLRTAAEALKADMADAEALAALQAQIAAYKKADIKQPEAGKTYQIVSAATYYKARYAGSTIYEKDNVLAFHYTPQTEPEELWQFEPQTGGGYVIRNLMSGKTVTMPAYESAARADADAATTVRIDRATKATGRITCVPGAVTISSLAEYANASNVKRFYGSCTGQVIAYDETALAYPGTWRIVEVTDFTAQLQGLCTKCERIVETSVPGETGEPSQEAIDFLQSSLLEPAAQALQQGNVSEAAYREFAEIYRQFTLMERTSILDGISEDHYYYIRNAYFTAQYARANASTKQVEPKALSATDNAFRWRFKKNSDGTVYIYNKATGTAATLNKDAEDQIIRVGNDYRWTLKEVTTDLGSTAIAIIDGSGAYSWYTNPSAWSYILTKPYDWGASIWTLERLEDPTGISTVETRPESNAYYDLGGRRVQEPTQRGVYIDAQGRKVLK